MGQAEWSDGDLEPLDGQLSQVVRLSLEHYRRTLEIPFARFRRRTVSRRPHARAWGCSAPLGKALSVDVDGQVYPCALFARSYQAFAPGIDERVRLLSMGDVRDPLLPGRLAALPDACRASGLFAPKRLQHSGERACATCRERSHCVICPVARVKRSSADDVNDIPRYLCTCERILGAHRRHFLAQAPPSSGEALLLTLLSERRTAEPTSKPSRSPLRPTAP
jgi:sulfatase maturation enzyme AslB (radical SAM superfamily)